MIGGFVGVDAPGRGLKGCIERGQRKHALAVQPTLKKLIEFRQGMVRVWLGHPEIRPGKVSSAHLHASFHFG